MEIYHKTRRDCFLDKVSTVTRLRRVGRVEETYPTLPRYGTDRAQVELFQFGVLFPCLYQYGQV
jgi:hypothetical protein